MSKWASVVTWVQVKLESVLTWVQDRLQPVMPWVFLAFRRALIPTLIALVGPLLFLGIDQGKDILYGLSEPRLVSWKADAWPFNVAGVSAYLVAAVGYALSVWYSARLLCTVEPQGLPRELTETEYEAPARWYPRLLGLITLLAAYVALLKACSERSIGGVLMGALGPTLLVVYGLLPKQWRARRRGRALLSCGAAGIIALGYCIFYVKWLLAVVLLLASGLPGAFFWFVVERRNLLNYGQASATQKRQFGSVVVRLVGWLGGCGLMLLVFGLSGASFLRACGSAALAFLFLASISLFIAVCHLIVRYCADGVSGLTGLLLFLFAVGVTVFGQEGLGQEELVLKSATPGFGAPGALVDEESGPSSSAPLRKVYISTYGGGIRAAAFTAQVLAEADDQSCGQFGRQLVALSGVSGGSVGIAVYLAARQEAVTHGVWNECKPDDSDQKVAKPLTGIVKDTLAQDHLAPVIARMLAFDAPHLVSTPTRGQALLDSLHHALLRAYDLTWGSNQNYPGLALRLEQLTGGRSPPIYAYFNAADVDTGQIAWFSNANNGSVRLQEKAEALEAPISVGQAMLHSARFPLISPAGRFLNHRLVDGGYIDNSGADTLARVMHSSEAHDLNTCWFVLDGNQQEPRPKGENGEVKYPPLVTPLQALLQARTGNAVRAVNALATSEGLPANTQRVVVNDGDRAPALGWYLSAAAAATLEQSARTSATAVLDAVKSGQAHCVD